MSQYKSALILIDIQNDYFNDGKLPLHQPEAAASKAASILSWFRSRGETVIHVQHENTDTSKPFLLAGSIGQKIHDSVAPKDGEVVITKGYPNAFWETELETTLKQCGVTSIVIVGMMTHMCVSTTARAAMERGFTVKVLADACATRSLGLFGKEISAELVHTTALAELQMLADVVNCESYRLDA
ncbi:cysteine hydrolase family protein [Vibrio chaetopteri]|uniref:Cysteine hydrolase family protein n=1 Tax=Vibrio chaetopteri TaxID=3016528 RepID=A0AAU8BQM5_9VIBR